MSSASHIISLKAPAGMAGELAGIKLLEEARAEYEKLPASSADVGAAVFIDLSDVELATTSFVKVSLLAFFQSGRASTETINFEVSNALGFQALNIYPVIANARPDVEDLVDEIFGRRKIPLVSVQLNKSVQVIGGRQLGFLDAALCRTMKIMNEATAASAASLHEIDADKDGVSQTAWSNRLNDLWRLRLLQRKREGKTWLYNTLVKGITYGR